MRNLQNLGFNAFHVRCIQWIRHVYLGFYIPAEIDPIGVCLDDNVATETRNGGKWHDNVAKENSEHTSSTHCRSMSVFYDTVSSVKNAVLTPFIFFHFAMQIFEYCYLNFSKFCQCNYNREFFTTFSHILIYLHLKFYSDSCNVSIANTLYIGKLFCDHTVHYLNNWQVYFWFRNKKIFIYVIEVNYFYRVSFDLLLSVKAVFTSTWLHLFQIKEFFILTIF